MTLVKSTTRWTDGGEIKESAIVYKVIDPSDDEQMFMSIYRCSPESVEMVPVLEPFKKLVRVPDHVEDTLSDKGVSPSFFITQKELEGNCAALKSECPYGQITLIEGAL